MKPPPLTWFYRPASQALRRPLTVPETAAMAFAILLIGTIYCQIYCLIAFQQMHGQAMPILTSIHRVSIDIVPGFVAFELSKRALRRDRGPLAIAVVILIFCVAIAVAAAARTTLTDMTDPAESLRKIVADRLPTLAIAAAALIWAQREAGRSARRDNPALSSGEAPGLPPAKFIESVRAAGNYVEIRFAGKTQLLRMPLRQVAAQLPEKQFVRVHRSIIVNRAHIASQTGRRSIRLNDGTEIRVGDAYRANLDQG